MNPLLSDILDVSNLLKLIAEGYISTSTQDDLVLYCYSKKAQFDQVWNHETMTCRGLIVDGDSRVIARPFPKFFNYGEPNAPIPPNQKPDLVQEKIDGSLGICFWNKDHWQIATKGSFLSTQAFVAQNYLRDLIYINDPNELYGPDTTTLFEIVYPTNRIVVNYGSYKGLALLTGIRNETGKDILPYKLGIQAFSFRPLTGHTFKDLNEISTIVSGPAFDYEEGVVAVWHFPDKPSLRLKFKNARYLKLHALLTKMTARKIWEILRTDGYPVLEEFIKDAPDEFQDWARNKADELLLEFHRVQTEAGRHCLDVLKYLQVKNFGGEPLDKETRKQFAIQVKDLPHKGLLFKLIDGKNINESIWQLIYPAHETPFMESDE